MALDEATRHALHLRFDELVGPDLAITSQTRTVMFGMIGTMLSTASVMLGAIAIGG